MDNTDCLVSPAYSCVKISRKLENELQVIGFTLVQIVL